MEVLYLLLLALIIGAVWFALKEEQDEDDFNGFI